MAFRADEAKEAGYEATKSYLIHRHMSDAERSNAESVLLDIIDDCGPVVESYPTWHPLVANHDSRFPETHPSERCGYHGLDHTRYFAHGFISCPYVDGQKIIDSVSVLAQHSNAHISAERLDVEFYAPGTAPVLVRCDWSEALENGKLVPKRLAVPLMLEKELPTWRWAERAEKWETMRPYLLGSPHGSRSSLFVSQETALAMKKVFVAMTESGMFGPLKMD